MSDLDALEAKAKAATPGPWKQGAEDECEGHEVQDVANSALVATTHYGEFKDDHTFSPDAAFISVANPSAILALCARVRVAEQERIDLREDVLARTSQIVELEAQLQQVRDALQGLLTTAAAHDCWGEEVKAAQAALAASGGVA